MSAGHWCVNGEFSETESWWVFDAQGIELCKVCDACEAEKLSKFRLEILTGYTQEYVDETIEAEDSY
jgi:hypothetical protein